MNGLASKALFDAEVSRLPRLAAANAWIVHEAVFPVLDVSFQSPNRRSLRVRLRTDSWNELPPVVDLLNPEGVYLTTGEAPTGRSNIFHQGPHDITGRPFVCMVGTREYHTHSSHLGDSWSKYLSDPNRTLLNLIVQIWQGWRAGA